MANKETSVHRDEEQHDWLRTLRRYLGFVALGNLVWEFAHMPLYTIWETGTAAELAFAAVHCTGGDILIALSAVMLALFLAGSRLWPEEGRRRVVVLTVLFGLVYTLFSEWLNIEVRQAWAYRDLMPVIPVIDAGVSPVLQWIVIPLAAFRWAMRPVLATAKGARGSDAVSSPVAALKEKGFRRSFQSLGRGS